MTNHDEAAGTSGNADMSGFADQESGDADGSTAQGSGGIGGAAAPASDDTGRGAAQESSDMARTLAHPSGDVERSSARAGGDLTGRAGPANVEMGGTPYADESAAYISHTEHTGPSGERQVTLRTPAELADALPYLLGYRPEDSIVLVALHDQDGRGRFGGRARLGIPAHSDDWASVAGQLAHGLVTGSERRGVRPESMVAYLCQEPASGETGRDVVARLQPLAQLLRTACGSLDVPVVEALCISDGHFWSYCCPSLDCCPPEGRPMGLPGTSVLAAAATYAGLQVRGSLREFRARLAPWETAAALAQEIALDAASAALVPRILDGETREDVAEETLGLARQVMGRFTDTPPVSGTLPADLRDDELLGHEEAATLILGLQDRTTRDRAAEWMEDGEAAPALRLWRALARRCVGSYGEHAAAPLTLAGWVAWSSGDELEAREALAMALGADPGYLFARLLHQACNEGLDPESVRRCLRAERKGRAVADGSTPPAPLAATASSLRSAQPPRSLEPQDPGASQGPRWSGPSVPSDSAEPTAPAGQGDGTGESAGVLGRHHRRARPVSGGSRPSRRSPRAVARRGRRPAEGTRPAADRTPGAVDGLRRSVEGPRSAADGASTRSRAPGGTARSDAQGDT